MSFFLAIANYKHFKEHIKIFFYSVQITVNYWYVMYGKRIKDTFNIKEGG